MDWTANPDATISQTLTAMALLLPGLAVGLDHKYCCGRLNPIRPSSEIYGMRVSI